MSSTATNGTMLDLFIERPLIRDQLVTETSVTQESTVDSCLEYLTDHIYAMIDAEPEEEIPGQKIGEPAQLVSGEEITLPFRTMRDTTQQTVHDEDAPLPTLPAYKKDTISPSKPLIMPKSPLHRTQHIAFLTRQIENARFMAYDASRPWVIYWCLTALALLGEDLSPYAGRVRQTLAPAQNGSGGFGSGHGQLSHCAPTYAAILSLAMVSNAVATRDAKLKQSLAQGVEVCHSENDSDRNDALEDDALTLIDRKALWYWLGHLKQADGGFRMCIAGEEDVRGAYCSMVIISLLSLPLDLPLDASARSAGLETFDQGLPEYFSRCQTYEGGISGSPQTEAHGAYAFCALACLSILGPPKTLAQYLDIPDLMAWLSSRQYAPEGGFSGRTNKLVDGCYSHWVGGCWPFISAAIRPSSEEDEIQGSAPEVSPLFSREGLALYIYACCQAESGGLRDKPTAYPDAYHTCYTLCGLSSTQHDHWYDASARKVINGIGHSTSATRTDIPKSENSEHTLPECQKDVLSDDQSPQATLSSPFKWQSRPVRQTKDDEEDHAFWISMNPQDQLSSLHPIFVIPYPAVSRIHEWSNGRPWR